MTRVLAAFISPRDRIHRMIVGGFLGMPMGDHIASRGLAINRWTVRRWGSEEIRQPVDRRRQRFHRAGVAVGVEAERAGGGRSVHRRRPPEPAPVAPALGIGAAAIPARALVHFATLSTAFAHNAQGPRRGISTKSLKRVVPRQGFEPWTSALPRTGPTTPCGDIGDTYTTSCDTGDGVPLSPPSGCA